MTTGRMAPRILDAGETALVVEFGATIDLAIHDRVLALDLALAASPPAGLLECVPTYRSLMIHYDPLIIDRARLVEAVERCLASAAAPGPQRRHWRVPACYDAAFADDLAHVAAATGLTPAEVVRLHAGARYRVFMYGFSPGWAYLGGLPAALTVPRRTSPRDRIAAGSLIIAGGQAIIAGRAMPSGWHILGRTPEQMFAADRDPSFLVAVGDLISFAPIDRPTYEDLALEAQAGAIVASWEVAP